MKFTNKDIQIAHYGKKTIATIYKGLCLIMQMGNFFTRNNELFVTKDNETFEVREE